MKKFICKSNGKSKNGKTFFILFALMVMAVIVINIYACRSFNSVDNSPVKAFDINRFLGKWYEIARFDHRFERGMTHCIANYDMKEDGSIIVTNYGRKDGEWETSVGKAKTTVTPGALRVSFFGPFYSDYRVLFLAPDYSYALIGGSDDSYLWILSRTPVLEKSVRDSLLLEAARRGYKTENLIWVDHTAK